MKYDMSYDYHSYVLTKRDRQADHKIEVSFEKITAQRRQADRSNGERRVGLAYRQMEKRMLCAGFSTSGPDWTQPVQMTFAIGHFQFLF
jgi:hypothetical protein